MFHPLRFHLKSVFPSFCKTTSQICGWGFKVKDAGGGLRKVRQFLWTSGLVNTKFVKIVWCFVVFVVFVGYGLGHWLRGHFNPTNFAFSGFRQGVTPIFFRVQPKSPLCEAHSGDFIITYFRVKKKKFLKTPQSTQEFSFFLKPSRSTLPKKSAIGIL